MNSQTVGLRVAGTIFGLLCLGHLLRLLTRAEVIRSLESRGLPLV